MRWLIAALAWQAMMTVMMAPAAAPWLRAVGRLLPPQGAQLRFGAGYVAAWVPFSAALGAAQLALSRQFGTVPALGAGLLLLAGIYQFAPLKSACLRHCRNPASAILARWRNGPPSAFRLGLDHGLVCLGCCWALMATALALGMMNYWWMAALAFANWAEQTQPRGAWLQRALGLGLVAAAAALYWGWR